MLSVRTKGPGYHGVYGFQGVGRFHGSPASMGLQSVDREAGAEAHLNKQLKSSRVQENAPPVSQRELMGRNIGRYTIGTVR